jgi:hypothetical protein
MRVAFDVMAESKLRWRLTTRTGFVGDALNRA